VIVAAPFFDALGGAAGIYILIASVITVVAVKPRRRQ